MQGTRVLVSMGVAAGIGPSSGHAMERPDRKNPRARPIRTPSAPRGRSRHGTESRGRDRPGRISNIKSGFGVIPVIDCPKAHQAGRRGWRNRLPATDVDE